MHVYVLASSPHGPTKIGRTNNPEKRLATLKTGNPNSLELYHSEPTGYQAAHVERLAHEMLASSKSCGSSKEWFEVSPFVASAVVRIAAKAFQLVADRSTTLDALNSALIIPWFRIQGEYVDFCDENEIDCEILESIEIPRPLQLLAKSRTSTRSSYPSFSEFLETHQDGALYRWAFKKLGCKAPKDNKIDTYLKAAHLLAEHGYSKWDSIFRFENPELRWFEWQSSRKLNDEELQELTQIWNNLADQHNKIKGRAAVLPELRAKLLYRSTGDSLLVFVTDTLRLVVNVGKTKLLKSECRGSGSSYEASYEELKQMTTNSPITGFVSSCITAEMRGISFLPCIEKLPESRDEQLRHLIHNPAQVRLIADEHKAGTPWLICGDLPHLDADGYLQ